MKNCPSCGVPVGNSIFNDNLYQCKKCGKFFCTNCCEEKDECPNCHHTNTDFNYKSRETVVL